MRIVTVYFAAGNDLIPRPYIVADDLTAAQAIIEAVGLYTKEGNHPDFIRKVAVG